MVSCYWQIVKTKLHTFIAAHRLTRTIDTTTCMQGHYTETLVYRQTDRQSHLSNASEAAYSSASQDTSIGEDTFLREQLDIGQLLSIPASVYVRMYA